jgi:hypothetical protein
VGVADRTRAELEALIAACTAEHAPMVERYNHLLAQKVAIATELDALEPRIRAYNTETCDLDFQYFRALQRCGALPSPPVVKVVAYDKDRRRFLLPEPTDTEERQDDGRSDDDFEVGEKG